MRIKVRSRSGQPAVGSRSQSFGALRTFRNPVFKKRSVRTLIKSDESKGVRSPEYRNLTDGKGVDTGRGFASSAQIVRQRPQTPPTRSSFKRYLTPPRLGPLKRGKNSV
jgi:hypothetical protein